MIYIFPVSVSDAHLIDPFCDAIKHLGGMDGRKCLVIGDRRSGDHVDFLASRLKIMGATVEKDVFAFECAEGWPQACNRYFYKAASLAMERHEPFFYLELDHTPIRSGWQDMVESEYRSGVAQGLDFMGRLAPHTENRMGAWVQSGSVMNGSGVYPANFIERSTLIQEISRIGVPWDIHLRWEMINQCKDASDFMVFNWHSTNYRWENGIFTCDINQRPGGIVHSGKSDPIQPRHYLVHGCKDGSLAKMIVAGEIDAPTVIAEEFANPAPIEAETDLELQGGQEVSRLAHTQKIVGSIPTPATKPKRSPKAKKRRKMKLSEAERARRVEHAKRMTTAREAKKNKIVSIAA